MDRSPAGWAWTKVAVVHAPDTRCSGEIYSYAYRYHPPDSPLYERCVGLSWCSTCRSYTGAMVHVPRDRVLVDVLADLGGPERDRLSRSEVRLLDHLDLLVRRGAWPPDKA